MTRQRRSLAPKSKSTLSSLFNFFESTPDESKTAPTSFRAKVLVKKFVHAASKAAGVKDTVLYNKMLSFAHEIGIEATPLISLFETEARRQKVSVAKAIVKLAAAELTRLYPENVRELLRQYNRTNDT
jgi:hypothetical protein